jgi:ATP-dependent DNA helicase RecG
MILIMISIMWPMNGFRARISLVTVSELQDHIAHLRRLNADHTHVEAKAATNELPKRSWETLSAFSNTPRGGALLLGVSEEFGFRPTGVNNPNKVQHDLANLCSDMEPAVRAHIELHRLRGKTIISAEIPEIPVQSEPCYYPPAGLTNGAFIR